MKLPPIGNGTYLVTMKLKKDMPNWVPMYGRKICLMYRGIKNQCNSCFGPHLRKFCKNERMSLEEYADKFRIRNPYVPEQLYGKLAKFENIVEQERMRSEATVKNSEVLQEPGHGNKPGSGTGETRIPTGGIATGETQKPVSMQPPPKRLTVTLRKSVGNVWTSDQAEPSATSASLNPGRAASNTLPLASLPVTSVADNVSSFLNGIRASFRSDNINVMSKQQPKRSNLPVTNSESNA